MRKATGKESYTIAGFLNNAEKIMEPHGGYTYYVIDEASMVDLKTAYRLFQLLPENFRMIVIGDPYQLPPIGASLVFHKLVVLTAPTSLYLSDMDQRRFSAQPAYQPRAFQKLLQIELCAWREPISSMS